MYLTHSIIHQFHCYGSSEVTKRLIYYPRSEGFFQYFNAELVSISANFEPYQHVIHYAHNSLQLLSDFLTIIFFLLGLRAISQMMPNYGMCQGSSEPALGFRWSLVYVIICLCCSSRTFSTWTNNFTMHMVKLFAFVWKQRWSSSIIYMYMQTTSPCTWWTCLYILTSHTYLVISSWYLLSSNVTTQGENWVFHLVKW